MSQAKVEKRKYEKKNRAAIMRKHRRHKIIGWCIFGVIVGCILASTLGVKIYEAIPKYVDAEKLDAYVSEVWAEGGYGSEFFPSDDTASDTDAEESEDTDDTDAEESEDTDDTDAEESEDTDDASEDTEEDDTSAESSEE